ncbi:MAG: FAD-binding oxidoreductase [Theionarchaea archaeon]|nr:FAD-binding oxidoreductase [Theionarchaea archaeon]
MKDELKSIFKERAFFDQEDLICYSRDAVPCLEGMPDAVVQPKNKREITELVKKAQEKQWNLVPRGRGTGTFGGAVPTEGGILVDFVRMNAIEEINAGRHCLRVQPGCCINTIERELKKEGLNLPVVPWSSPGASIGGFVATNGVGLGSYKYGRIKQQILDLTVITGNGDELSLGSATEYTPGYNLCELFVGSEGTLGFIIDILLTCINYTNHTVVSGFFKSFEDTLSCVADIAATEVTPHTMIYDDATTFNFVREVALNNREATIDPAMRNTGGYLLLAFEEWGDNDMNTLSTIFSQYGGRVNVGGISEGLWRNLSSFLPKVYRIGMISFEDTFVPVDCVYDVVQECWEKADELSVRMFMGGYVASRRTLVLFPGMMVDERDTEEVERVKKAKDEIIKITLNHGGGISALGSDKINYLDIYPERKEIMQHIKDVFDPYHIMNRGKLGLR